MLLAELLWPLIIFAFIVWVRTLVIPVTSSECHYDGRPMPSAGLLPLLQGIVCAASNPCYSTERAGQADFYPNAPILPLLSTLFNYTEELTDPNFVTSIKDVFEQAIQLTPLVSLPRTPPEYFQLARDLSSATVQHNEDVFYTALFNAKLENKLNPKTRNTLAAIGVGQPLRNFDIEEILQMLRDPANARLVTILAERMRALEAQRAKSGGSSAFLFDSSSSSSSDPATLRTLLCKDASSQSTGLWFGSFLLPRSKSLSALSDLLSARTELCSLAPNEMALVLDALLLSTEVTLANAQSTNATARTLTLGQLLPEMLPLSASLNSPAYVQRIDSAVLNMSGSIDAVQATLAQLGSLASPAVRKELTSVFRSLFNGSRADSSSNETDPATASSLRFLCGETPSLVPNERALKPNTADSFQGRFVDRITRSSSAINFPRPRWENDTTDYCNKWFEELETNATTRLLWLNMKPLIRGRILYTPDTPETARLVSIANATFERLAQWISLADQWPSVSNYTRETLSDPNVTRLIDAFTKTCLHLNPSNSSNYHFCSFLRRFFMLNETNITVSNSSFFWTTFSILENMSLEQNFVYPNLTWPQLLQRMDAAFSEVKQNLQCFKFSKFEPVKDERELERQGEKLMDERLFWAGVVFTNFDSSNEHASSRYSFLDYKLRMSSDRVDNTRRFFDRIWTPGPRARPPIDLKYIYYGFAFLQDMIENAYISFATNVTPSDGLALQLFPYPCFRADRFTNVISRSIPFLMVMSWVFTVAVTIKNVVVERERKLRLVMRVMGLRTSSHWISWFLQTYAQVLLSAALLVALIKIGGVMQYTDATLLYFYLISFGFSTTMLAFLISTLFNRANVAAVCGAMLFYATYFPYMLIVIWQDHISMLELGLASLLSNVAFGLGCQNLALYEEMAVGAQWSNIFTSPRFDDTYTLARAIMFFYVDSIIYAILIWYIENLKPIDQDGSELPFYFLFTPSYWGCKCCSRDKNSRARGESESRHNVEMNGNTRRIERFECEQEPIGLEPSVRVNNLTKTYDKSQPPALYDVSISLYPGQISALLGHNGAGKTTMLSILTGLLGATAGDVVINGFSLRTQISKIRKQIGFCPQHNVLFDQLTVEEHIKFYARLKGVKPEEEEREIVRFLAATRLTPKRHTQSSDLSGGMKRKLSISIAFIGGLERNRLVILDEPTAGVDPHSRRGIWNLITSFKKDHTILLTTHHMDEADLLSDRIFVLNRGQLVCAGSSIYLKHKFGSGYRLVLVKATNSVLQTPPVVDGAEVDGKLGSNHRDALTALIARFIPSAQLLDESQTEYMYLLPWDDEELKEDELMESARESDRRGSGAQRAADLSTRIASSFIHLFQELDRHLHDLALSSYGLMSTSLEEVFLYLTPSTENPPSVLALDQIGIKVPQHSAAMEGFNVATHPSYLTTTTLPPGESLQPFPSNPLSSTPVNNGPLVVDSSNLRPATPPRVIDNNVLEAHAEHCTDEHVEQHLLSANDSKSGGILPKPTTPRSHHRNRKEQFKRQETRERLRRSKQRKDVNTTSNSDKNSSRQPAPEANGLSQDAASNSTVSTNNSCWGRTVRFLNRLKSRVSHHDHPESGVITDGGRVRGVGEYDVDDPPAMPALKRHKRTGLALFWQQFTAMFIKRFHLLRRSKVGFVAEVLLPAGFIVFAMLVSEIFPASEDMPPLEMQPWLLSKRTLTSQDSEDSALNLFYSLRERDRGDAQSYERSLVYSPHHGTRCMDTRVSGGIPEFACAPQLETPASIASFYSARPNHTRINNTADDLALPDCHCTSEALQCRDRSIWSKDWPHTQVSTTDIMRMLTTHNISQFIIRTTPVLQRYLFGGYSFEYRPPVGISSQHQTNSRKEVWLLRDLGTFAANASDFFQTAKSILSSLVVPHVSRVWFNNKGWISSVAYMNALNNVRLRSIASKSNLTNTLPPASFGIRLINHPMNETLTQLTAGSGPGPGDSQMVIATSIIFALSFVPAVFVMFLIEERITRSKLLQFLNGLSPIMYWFGNFIWDYLQFLFCSSLCLLIILAFKFDMYSKGENLPVMFITTYLYGFAAIPLIYPFCYLFTIPSTAFVILSSANLFIGIITVVMTVIFESFDEQPDLVEASKWMKIFFPILPQYSLGRSFVEIATLQVENDISEKYFGKTLDKSLFDFDVCGKFIMIFVLEGILFHIFYIGLQFNFWIKFKTPEQLLNSLGQTNANNEDEDVFNERARVLNLPSPTPFPLSSLNVPSTSGQGQEPLPADNASVTTATTCSSAAEKNEEISRLVNLTKVYQSMPLFASLSCCSELDIPGPADMSSSEKTLPRRTCCAGCNKSLIAVRNLCLSLRKGECFGLLGVNGAGKTSTFKMLTGDHSISSGDAYLCGYSVKNELQKVQSLIGYCPQFDALNALLTGQEHLEYYARIRGLHPDDINHLVNWLLHKLDVYQHRKKPTEYYSGGTKRKLSTALALVGRPALIFLDEPTTGMDPGAKRFLWACINSLRQELHCTVILTTHSMEECEVLCQRLAIMVNGEFKCLGSVQHLKTKFGNGHSLQLRLDHDKMYEMNASKRTETVNTIFEELRRDLHGLQINDKQATILEFHLPHSTELSVASVASAATESASSFPQSSSASVSSVNISAPGSAPVLHTTSVGQIFECVERVRTQTDVGVLILDYTVCQTTLDQVFINFARLQKDFDADELADDTPQPAATEFRPTPSQPSNVKAINATIEQLNKPEHNSASPGRTAPRTDELTTNPRLALKQTELDIDVGRADRTSASTPQPTDLRISNHIVN